MMTNKEATKALQDIAKYYSYITPNKELTALKMAINALQQTAWIPVGERLPEVGERVLVTRRVTRFRNETHIARYNVTRWCSFGTISNKNIVAWMPLPEAEDMYQPPEQRYLCQLEAYGERKFCVLSRLKGAVSPFWDWYGVAVHDSEVVAWLPLPEPYKGGDNND